MTAPGCLPSHFDPSRADELLLWAVSIGASTWICDLEPYLPARVAGIVDRTLIGPRKGVIEAFVWDGSGCVLARWHIRRPTPELALVPGRRVLLDGVPRLGETGLVMVEPAFWPALSQAAA